MDADADQKLLTIPDGVAVLPFIVGLGRVDPHPVETGEAATPVLKQPCWKEVRDAIAVECANANLASD